LQPEKLIDNFLNVNPLATIAMFEENNCHFLPYLDEIMLIALEQKKFVT